MLGNENTFRAKKIKKILKEKEKTPSRKPISALVTPNLEKIRTRIAIDRKPYSKKELAQILDMDEKNYGHIERRDTYIDKKTGKEKPYKLSFEKALKISQIYNVSLDYIYGLSKKEGDQLDSISLLQKIFTFDIKEGTEEIILKLNENIIKCLLRNQQLEEKYHKVFSEEEYKKYEYEKAKIEEELTEELENINKNNILGYYLKDIEKSADYTENERFTTFLTQLQDIYHKN